MGNPKAPDPESSDTDSERRLRGGDLGGSEKKRSVDHMEYEKRRDPDTELRLGDEEDTLYDDGLDIEQDDETLAGTRGSSSGAKP